MDAIKLLAEIARAQADLGTIIVAGADIAERIQRGDQSAESDAQSWLSMQASYKQSSDRWDEAVRQRRQQAARQE